MTLLVLSGNADIEIPSWYKNHVETQTGTLLVTDIKKLHRVCNYYKILAKKIKSWLFVTRDLDFSVRIIDYLMNPFIFLKYLISIKVEIILFNLF